MRSDICSIPIEDIFEPKDGCPICRMKSMLEDRLLEYTLGASMMEPDTRIETNKKGFCPEHYEMMFQRRNKLSLALILSTHLEEIQKKVYGENRIIKPSVGKSSKGSRISDTCFICEHLDASMDALLNNLIKHYEKDFDFRKIFAEQDTICFPHFILLSEYADKIGDKKIRRQFRETASDISKRTLDELKNDINKFCEMFDYRNNTEDADWGNSKDSIERTISWLSSEKEVL